ncbi:MAG: hypothetical protein NVSMB57_14930 [Actinomycetota bacterium]
MKFRFLAIAALLCVPAVAPHAGSALPAGSKQASMGWSPGRPEAKHDVTFSISASEPNGQISTVKIEYGDGATDTIVAPRSVLHDAFGCVIGDTFSGSVRHRFSHTGDFPVRLIVTSAPCPGSMQDPTLVVAYTVSVVRSETGGSGNASSSEQSPTSHETIPLPISG